tara:strand:+ start:10601 stop:10786 length:186 start_codon:yes stop_codon:yes gene_type:complete
LLQSGHLGRSLLGGQLQSGHSPSLHVKLGQDGQEGHVGHSLDSGQEGHAGISGMLGHSNSN